MAVKRLKITVLTDNREGEDLGGEWGLSVLIEADGRRILLDAGQSGLFAENAEKLGESIADVDFAFLSHAHYDHADGLERFFELNDHAPVYIRDCAEENCWGEDEDGKLIYQGIKHGLLEAHKDRFVGIPGGGCTEIAEDIFAVPHKNADYSGIALRGKLYTLEDGVPVPDTFAHEQSLVFRTVRGLVIFNSCSHTGVPNIVSEVREALGDEKILAYVGGLHLFCLPEKEVERVIDFLEVQGIEQIYTGHCTGEGPFGQIRKRMGDSTVLFRTGFTKELVAG